MPPSFSRRIVPRERRHGRNPGQPTSIGRDGSFFDVEAATIVAVRGRNQGTVEVVAGWGHLLPGGQTLFVLKRIDGIKSRRGDDDWDNALLGPIRDP